MRVKANQSTDNNYQASDYLEAVDATVTFADKQLAFKHRTAKVVVTLQAGDFVTDLTGAAVTFVNQIGVDGNGTDVTPKTETIDGITTYSALLIPQNMQGKQFIKVTISDKNYYYTPKGMENANLRAGYVENYTITVKQNGLSVVWQQGEQIDNTAEEATFKIYLNAFTAPQNTSYKVTDANGTELQATDGVYTLTGNELNISLTVDEGYLFGFSTNITGGIGKRKKTLANNTYTYTFYDIRSDLWLSKVQATITSSPTEYTNVSVGDYFYSDGTCSSALDNNKTCIGIVFKVGVGQGDKIDNYDSFLTGNTIHGYVAALINANSGQTLQWSTANVATGVSTSQENFDGYSNTLILRKKDDSQNKYPAVWACIYNNNISAPISSSSWYLPSYAQMKELSTQEDDKSFAAKLEAVQGSIMKVGGNPDFWTSSEDNNTNVWHFSGYNGGTFWNDHAKTNSDYVRAVLTF